MRHRRPLRNLREIPGLVLWLSAGHQGEGDGVAVQTFYDQSGRSGDPTQATSGKRAIMRGMSELSGRPALDFDGSDDAYQVASVAYGLSDFTCVCALFSDSASGGGTYLVDSETDRLIFALAGAGSLNNRYYDGSWHGGPGGFPSATTVATWRLSSTLGASVRENGVPQLTGGSFTQRNPAGKLGVGGDYDAAGGYLNARVAELGIWNRYLVDGELQRVEAAWITRYAHEKAIGGP